MVRGLDKPAVPLSLRLPNPPPAFTGRVLESNAVRDRLRRGALVCIAGPAGCGKTALALHTLFELGADWVARSLWLPLAFERGDTEPALRSALRVVAGSRQGDPLDTQQCVDWADSVAAVVVVDHFEPEDPAASSWLRLFAAASQYARRSRWLVTSRSPLAQATLEGQSVELGPMAEDELCILAQQWAVALPTDEASSLARAARGSPLELRQQLVARMAPSHAAPAREVEARLEAARAALQRGEHGPACQQLEDALDRSLSAGLAATLWSIVAGSNDPRYDRVKLACAAELGAGPALEWAVRQPAPAPARERLRWLRVMAYSGKLVAAAAGAKELCLACDGSEVAFDAGFLSLRCLVTLGLGHEALTWAEQVRRFSAPSQQPLLEVWRARAQVLVGDHDAALELVTRVEGAGDEEPTRREIALQRAIVLSSLGRARTAYALLDGQGGEGVEAPEQRGMQRWLVREALVAVELGRTAAARAALERLAPFSARSIELSILSRRVGLRIALAEGDTQQARAQLASLRRETSVLGPHQGGGWLAPLERYFAWRCGYGDSSGPNGSPLDEEPAPAPAQRIHASRAALLRGDHRSAREQALAALELSRAEGLALWEGDAHLALVEACYCAEDPALERAVRELQTFAATLGLGQLEAEAAFFREASRFAQADAQTLLRLALLEEECIAASRRARAFFGAPCALDRVDELVLARLATRLRAAVLDPGGEASDRVELGRSLLLDASRACVVGSDGARLDLSSKPLSIRLLSALFEAGGAASKAELVRSGWGRERYHPLQDDKRLQVAIGRLRASLGDCPPFGERIVTTAEGYRFAPGLRVLSLIRS